MKLPTNYVSKRMTDFKLWLIYQYLKTFNSVIDGFRTVWKCYQQNVFINHVYSIIYV